MASLSEIPPKELRELFDPAMWQEVADALCLSPRELEVAQAVFHDMSRKEMATHLHLHLSTIHTYVDRVFSKAGVKDGVALVERLVGLALAAQAKRAQKPVNSADRACQ